MMFMVSCRSQFTSTRWFTRKNLYRHYSQFPPRPHFVSTTLANLQSAALNRHVCILVHGYNNTLTNVLDAYQELYSNLGAYGLLNSGGYGLVIGFTWPGWQSALGFLAARAAANRAGTYLHQLITGLRPAALSVDVQTHSLGARVVLAALKIAPPIFVDNLLLSAAAVDHSVFRPGREFHSTLTACNRCWVYFSRRDSVLKKAYPVADFVDGIQKALGLAGPQSPHHALAQHPNLYPVDCTAHVAQHGDYRKTPAYYAHWHRILSGAPLPRPDTLAPPRPLNKKMERETGIEPATFSLGS